MRWSIRENSTDRSGDTTYIDLMKKAGMSDEEIAKKLKTTSRTPPPEVPVEGEEILGVFTELSRARQTGQGGPQAITFPEIKAYCDLYDLELDAVELNIIGALDQAWMEEVNIVLERRMKAK